MEQFGSFVLNHWELFLALSVILGMLAATGMGAGLAGIHQVDPVRAIQLISHEGAVVLDVRELEEYRQGHVLNSVHIPLAQLRNDAKPLQKHRSKPIITVCRSGARSLQAGRLLRQHGFDTVYNLKGGIQAWRSANLPVSSKG